MNLQEISEAATAAKSLSAMFEKQAKIAEVAQFILSNKNAISELEAAKAKLAREVGEAQDELAGAVAARSEADEKAKAALAFVDTAKAAAAAERARAQAEAEAMLAKAAKDSQDLINANMRVAEAKLAGAKTEHEKVTAGVNAKKAELEAIEKAIAALRDKIFV